MPCRGPAAAAVAATPDADSDPFTNNESGAFPLFRDALDSILLSASIDATGRVREGAGPSLPAAVTAVAAILSAAAFAASAISDFFFASATFFAFTATHFAAFACFLSSASFSCAPFIIIAKWNSPAGPELRSICMKAMRACSSSASSVSFSESSSWLPE